jgi:hypothetical protein
MAEGVSMSPPAPAVLAPPVEDSAAITANDAVVRRIEAVADRFAAAGSAEDAAACAQIGSMIAWMNHPGRFASAPFERVLRPGARALAPVSCPAVPDDPRRILHVMTEGYTTGGHTRLAWRWMLADSERVHGLALTRHRPVPKTLIDAVAERGNEPIHACSPDATLLERAQQLRAAAAGYHLVLLHAHPDDPVPSLAFGAARGTDTSRPPVVLVNHADHCFWLGREAADLVVSHRELGSKIAREQRGVPVARTALLPLPLAGATASGDRETARRELGIAPDQVVLLTVGSAYKFVPVGGPHFLDAAEPVVARNPEAVLLAIGPSDSGRFLEARQRTGGRVRALGGLASIDHLYAAADVYLESYPCSSGTAVREAAAYGSAVLTFAPDPVEAEMLGSDSSLADVWQRASTVEEYVDLATELIRDGAARAAWGDAARESVAESHDEARWVEGVEHVYRRAIKLGPVDACELDEPNEELCRYDTIVHRIHAYSGKQVPLDQASGETERLELVAQSTAVRLAYGSLVGAIGLPAQRGQFAKALAAPVADAAQVWRLVDEFRRLARTAVATGFAMVAAPASVDELVPLIEAALASGPDVDIDLVVHEDPLSANDPGTLLVRADGDAFGSLSEDEFPLQLRLV